MKKRLVLTIDFDTAMSGQNWAKAWDLMSGMLVQAIVTKVPSGAINTFSGLDCKFAITDESDKYVDTDPDDCKEG